MKQTIITLFGEGYLNNVNLKEENNAIKGTVSIKVGETESVLFSVYCNKMNKNSDKENFKYPIFKAIMNEYISSNKEPDYRKTDKMFIPKPEVKYKTFPNATIKTNLYKKDGKLVDGEKRCVEIMYKKPNDFFAAPKISFTVENLLVESILPEYDSKGEVTGRGILNGYVIDHTSMAAKIKFILKKEGYDYAKTAWVLGDTVNVSGDIVSRKVKKLATPTNVAFGSTYNDDADEWIDENLIIGAEEKLVDGFSLEDISTVMMNYENKKEKLLSEQTFLSSGIDSPVAGFVSVPQVEGIFGEDSAY